MSAPSPRVPPFGLGRIPSPPDDRDYPIARLFALAEIEPELAAPATYRVPGPFPPVLNQGSTPQCVAYSHSWLKAYQDLRDTGPVDLDEGRYFTAIGGSADGAVIRVALEELLDVGYPPVAGQGSAGQHRIAGYYRIPLTQADLQAAILAFGPIELGLTWPWSWFRPKADYSLPKPNAAAGGHGIVADGWDARGLELVNSWGTAYGDGGRVWMPWAYLGQLDEAWKAADVIDVLPATYSLAIAQGTKTLRAARLSTSGTCIAGWSELAWSGNPSSAPCAKPETRPGCYSGQATTARVLTGRLAGKLIRIGDGVTVART